MSPISFCMTLLFVFVMFMPIATGCPSDERNYLLDIKGALLDRTGCLSSWQGYNCCHWKGVGCDTHSRHVIILDLKNRYDEMKMSLGGEIHPSLFNLQHLQHLDFSGNDFNGTAISPHLGKLKKLTFLSFANARFHGEIPMEIGNLSVLRHLDLSYARFGGDFSALRYGRFGGDLSALRHLDLSYGELKSSRFVEWIGNLRSLEYLAMRDVNLTTASEHWGEALTSLSNLRHVDLSWCGLSGSPIPSLLNLTRLSHLHLRGNSFPFPLPTWFQNVSSLVSLDLSYCKLNCYIPSNFLPRSSITNVDLSFNSLKGDLSFILHHSSSLKSLFLYYNSLEGVIPPSIANFSRLEKLNLAWNNFTGYIPPFGSPLPLSSIDLSHNSLRGNIPPSIGCLPLLRELFLRNNQLSGPIPGKLFRLVRLETLILTSNKLVGNISLSLFDSLTQLRELCLSHNSFTVSISPSWLPQFAYLRFLGLCSCNIQGDFPAFLSTQYLLENLEMSDNNIVGNIPTWLWHLPKLFAIKLSNNQLLGTLPSVISKHLSMVILKRNRLHGSLPALHSDVSRFDVSENSFSGLIPSTVAASVLILSQNNLTGDLPLPFCTDRNTVEIQDLSKNKLKGTISPNFGRCKGLKVLNLAQNDLQGEIPEQLGNLTSLRTLNLNGNNLQGTIPSSIRNCTVLQVLDIGNNNIQGSIPVWIGELAKLRILNMASNKLGGTVPPWLVKLKYLQILDLSHNNLFGHIPANLGKLPAMINQSRSGEPGFALYQDFGNEFLEYIFMFPDQVTLWIKGRATPYEQIFQEFRFIDLSHNKLSGCIPPEMGQLKYLISLNISKNNLSGSIPKSFGGMVELESLDLSRNKLSGKIPSELVNLTFLAALNLSDNMLSGLIPQSKQFLTFEASSFGGNPNLQGPPLENRTLNSGLGGKGSHQELHNTVEEAEADEDEDEMDRWWAVAVGLSYGVGFSTVIGVLCFHIKWRIKYFDFLDNLMPQIFEGRL